MSANDPYACTREPADPPRLAERFLLPWLMLFWVAILIFGVISIVAGLFA